MHGYLICVSVKPRLIPVFLPIPEQEIMIDRFVEQLLESGHVTGLAQGPHGLGYGGFQGHIVGLDEIKLILHHLSDLIDFHIAALVGDLGRHNDNFPGGDELLDHLMEAVVPVIGKAADAERLDDHGVIGIVEGLQNPATDARNQFQEKDPVV